MATTRAAVTEIRPATIAELLKHDGAALFEAAWNEVDGTGRLQIDWAQYQALEDRGMLVVWGVWAEQQLVGYSATAIMPGLHTAELGGELLSMFVRPGYRRGGIGSRLIRLTQESADAAGAKLRWRAKRGKALDLVLRRSGYEDAGEVVYVKKASR